MNTTYTFVFLEIFSCEGGIQSYVKDVLRAYQQRSPVSADVFLLRDRGSCDNPLEQSATSDGASHGRLRFHYLGLPLAGAGRARLAMVLAWHLWRQRPSRVICGHINLAPLVHRLCHWLQIPYTVMTYGKEVWHPLPSPSRLALQQAQTVWTISRYSRDLACKANGLDPQKVQFLPCIVDGTIFTPGSPRSDLMERYGLRDSRVLMTVARLWSGDIYKGVDVTIRALPTIAAAFPDVKYLVIGRGDDQPRLARLAADLGMADRVVFAGFVPTPELRDHYRLADAYVMPSQEGFGIVYLEAMACGVPVLAGDRDGSADPLQDGRLGWQVPHRNSEAVAAACIEMLQGEDPRCRGDWLRQEALAGFSPQSLETRLAKLLWQSE